MYNTIIFVAFNKACGFFAIDVIADGQKFLTDKNKVPCKMSLSSRNDSLFI